LNLWFDLRFGGRGWQSAFFQPEPTEDFALDFAEATGEFFDAFPGIGDVVDEPNCEQENDQFHRVSLRRTSR
jgi:hypothetical protein